MVPPRFEILFDSPTNAYYAGTAVTGRVLLALDKPKKARGLKIVFAGEAKVSWQDTESERKNDGTTQNETVVYHAEEQYFTNSYYLLGSANGDIEIPVGEQVFPFTTTLPPRLPSSFNGEFGNVRYSVTAKVDRPWKSDYEAVGIFNVVTPVDLNYVALAKEPAKADSSKTFCCWCCKSGPLTLAIHVPFTGIVPGQTFPVVVEVDNASNVSLEAVRIIVAKKTKWMVRMPRYREKEDSVELVKVTCEGIEHAKSRTWTQSVSIPEMVHVDMTACSIIEIKFQLEVVAVVVGMHSNLSVSVPLILGTVPIVSEQTSTDGLNPLQPAVIMGQPLPGLVALTPAATNLVQPTPIVGRPLPGLVNLAELRPSPTCPSDEPNPALIGFNVPSNTVTSG